MRRKVKGPGEILRRDAEGYLERLESKYNSQALELALKNAPQRLRPALVEAMIARASEHRFDNPEETLTWARYAVALAEDLGGSAPPGLLARAYAEVGNALRIQERFSEARLPFQKAEEAMKGAPLYIRAEVLSLYASLLDRTGLWSEAVRTLQSVRRILRRLGRIEDETRILVQLGGALVNDQAFHASRQVLDIAVQRLHATPGDPALRVAAYNNVLYGIIEEASVTSSATRRAELIDQALVGAMGVKSFFDRHATPAHQLQLEWNLGRLFLAEGKLNAAYVHLKELVGKFLEQRKPFSAAASALDLCLVLTRQRRADELRAAAASAALILKDEGIRVDFWRALKYLSTANDLQAAEAFILRTLKRCGAPSLGAPRSLDPN